VRRYDKYGYIAPVTEAPLQGEDEGEGDGDGGEDYMDDLKREKAFFYMEGENAENVAMAGGSDELSGDLQEQLVDDRAFFFYDEERSLSSTSLDNVRQVQGNYKLGVHWRKGAVLGTGAFATCYAGFDLTLGSLIAVKQVHLIRNSSLEEERLISEVCEEIRLTRKLQHPNIVRYLTCELEDNHLNIVLEHVAGGSIASLLSKYGPFPEVVIKRYLKQMVAGLTYLHAEGILHRDLKGANVLVDSDGTVKVADFGASARLKSLTTFTGEFKCLKGTPAFMAPEVIRGESYGRKSDVWSLGAVVVEMATGSPPWVESKEDLSNPFAIMYRIASSTELPKLPGSLSAEARDFVLLCMRRDQEERPAAAELVDHPFLR